MQGSKEQPVILIYRSGCADVQVSIIVIKVIYIHLQCNDNVSEHDSEKKHVILMDVGKLPLYPFYVFFAPQDSDGDKSEDNLVVDVSNEASCTSV